MIAQLAQPVLILLRKRLPQTREEWLSFGAIIILYFLYYLIKEKKLQGIFKWCVVTSLFIGSTFGIFMVDNRWYKYFFWCLTGAFLYCVLFELLKKFTISRRGTYIPPGEEYLKENITLTEEEEIDINKIALVLLVLWLIAGFFITRKI